MSSYPPPPQPVPPQSPGTPDHFPPLPPQYARPKTWYQRNWKWFVPLLLVVVATLFLGFIATVYFGVTHMMRGSVPYQVAVEHAMKNPNVQAKLGAPIRIGQFISGSLNTSDSSGSAILSIPMEGPTGSGRVYVRAEKSAGNWRYEVLEFLSDDGAAVNLLDSTLPQVPGKPSLMPDEQQSDDGRT